jgi:hypothetical protein
MSLLWAWTLPPDIPTVQGDLHLDGPSRLSATSLSGAMRLSRSIRATGRTTCSCRRSHRQRSHVSRATGKPPPNVGGSSLPLRQMTGRGRKLNKRCSRRPTAGRPPPSIFYIPRGPRPPFPRPASASIVLVSRSGSESSSPGSRGAHSSGGPALPPGSSHISI